MRTSIRRTLARFLVRNLLVTWKIVAMAATQMTAPPTAATPTRMAFHPVSVRCAFATGGTVSALMMPKNGKPRSMKNAGSTASLIQEFHASVQSLLIRKSNASVQSSLNQEFHVSVQSLLIRKFHASVQSSLLQKPHATRKTLP